MTSIVLKHWKQLEKDLGIKSSDFLVREEKIRGRKLMAIRWYGGKFSHVEWIVPLLPRSHHYCEPFGGSAAILLNKEPSPVETYNDIDGDLVNFFRVLRDKPSELIEKLLLTPFSREEFIKAWEQRNSPAFSDVERARLFFIRAEQVRIGLAQRATSGRWAWCLRTSRRGMAGAVSRWISRIDALWLVADRLRMVQIEHDDAINVILRYDSPDTLFYVDPPYLHDSRTDTNAYDFEMQDEDHVRLAEVLNTVQGKVALSGYWAPIMDRLYANWTRIEAPPRTIHSSKAQRQESLWINYPLDLIDTNVIEILKSKGFKFYEAKNKSIS